MPKIDPSLVPNDFLFEFKASQINESWSLDLRHALVIYDLLRSGLFQRPLEIGCHYGGSTTAFLQALDLVDNMSLTLCDNELTDLLLRRVGKHQKRNQIHIAENESLRFLTDAIAAGKIFDFVLLDGSHIYHTTYLEMMLLMVLNVNTVVLHDVDTDSVDDFGRNFMFDGPRKVLERYYSSKEWMIVLDNLSRAHELTHRGLALITRDQRVYEIAKSSFGMYCSS